MPAISSDTALLQTSIQEGISTTLPPAQPIDNSVSHAPVRKDILNAEEKKLALRNACLLYTSDAADERSSVDLGGRRIIKKKKNVKAGAEHNITNTAK